MQSVCRKYSANTFTSALIKHKASTSFRNQNTGEKMHSMDKAPEVTSVPPV